MILYSVSIPFPDGHCQGNLLRTHCRKLRVLEAFFFVFLAMSFIWIIKPMRNDWLSLPFLAGVVLIPFLSSYYHGDSLRDIGFRLDNFRSSAQSVGLFTLVAALFVMLIGFFAGSTLSLPLKSVVNFLTYPLWGLAQQYAMQGFIHKRLREGLNNRYVAVICTAGLFGIIHWPNPLLTAFTFFGGIAWCLFYDREPNLFTLAISHGILAVLVYYLGPEDWVRHLRIGPAYYTFH